MKIPHVTLISANVHENNFITCIRVNYYNFFCASVLQQMDSYCGLKHLLLGAVHKSLGDNTNAIQVQCTGLNYSVLSH